MASEKAARSRANAWLLDFGHGLCAAVGTRVLVHLIDDPKTYEVPCTPAYCREVAIWQNRLLPVMDMSARLGGSALQSRLLAVAAYLDQPGDTLRFGALRLAAPPRALSVEDAQACSLPDQPAAWTEFAMSCFEYQRAPVPVLHLARVFSRPTQ